MTPIINNNGEIDEYNIDLEGGNYFYSINGHEGNAP
jgi:hypothetical protein